MEVSYFVLRATLAKRSRFSLTLDLREQTVLVWGLTSAGAHWPLTVGEKNSAFTHLESPITTYITLHLPNFCEATIPCLLKLRQRFELNDFYVTNFFKRCGSYQAICWNCKSCIILISLITCKYDMISCLVSFITYLDKHRGCSRKVSFHWL